MKCKKIFPLIVLFLLYNLSCSERDRPDTLTFHFDRKATLIIEHNLHNNEHSIVGRYLPFLSPDYINDYKFTDKIKLNDTDDFFINYKISCPSETYLIIDRNLWLPVFLVPGDTLYISFNLSDSSKIIESIKFRGKYASINEYKIRRYEKLGESFEGKCAALGRANLSVTNFQNSIDSISAIEINFFEGYINNNPLPKWYMNYERNQIIYIAAFGKRYNLTYRKLLNIKEKEPNDYYDFLNNIKINNGDATISLYYYYFLNEYFVKFFPDDISQMNVSERKKIIGLKYLEVSDSLLTGEVKDIYKTFIISRYIIDFGLHQLAEKVITEQRNKLSDVKYINYLKNYLKNKSKLKPGVMAPEFYLLNTKGEYKSLANYKGSVILLNFWFPGCTPCIKEIPFEKELANDFRYKDFHLINICFFTTEENWQKAVNKLGMEGVNLFANANWQNKLIEAYKISAYPHYTIINKDGNIFSNNPKRPSEGVSEDILNLLTN